MTQLDFALWFATGALGYVIGRLTRAGEPRQRGGYRGPKGSPGKPPRDWRGGGTRD